VDATDPANISSVGGVNATVGVNEVFVSGKYAYAALDSVTGYDFKIYDIAGIDAPSSSIGSLAAGLLSVSDNAQFDNDLNIGNALNVGVGGINSAGALVINNSFTLETGSTTAYF
jgi:hypothetical protein